MAKWIKGEVDHEKRMGIFKLCVWPVEATKKNPYVAWALISGDGDSNVLPASGSGMKFESLTAAKRWIENEMRRVCHEAMRS